MSVLTNTIDNKFKHNGQSQCQGHISVEVIEVYIHTKYHVCTDYQT